LKIYLTPKLNIFNLIMVENIPPLPSDVVFCLPKYINNKITTRNSTNPYRIGLY